MTENENIINEEQPVETPVESTKVDEQADAVVVESTGNVTEEVTTVVEHIAEEEVAEIAQPIALETESEPVVLETESEPVVQLSKPRFKEKIKPEPADFDWDAIGKKHEFYSTDERGKLEQLYDKTLSSIGDHEVIDGVVVGKNNREIVVNIGFKSDGVIPVSEFRYNQDLKIGDKVEVYVENQEGQSGQLMLSHKKARILRSWDRINVAFEKEEIINGYVKCRTKGGLIVDVFGIEAFLPGSQIDVKPIRDYDVYVDKTMEFKVVKINQEYKNVVVSHKALIEDELEQQKIEIIGKLEKGQVLEGTVKNITSYGVFIDLGGVDGRYSYHRPFLGVRS